MQRLTRDELLHAIGQLCEYAIVEIDAGRKAQLIHQLNAAVEAYTTGEYDRGPPTRGRGQWLIIKMYLQ